MQVQKKISPQGPENTQAHPPHFLCPQVQKKSGQVQKTCTGPKKGCPGPKNMHPFVFVFVPSSSSPSFLFCFSRGLPPRVHIKLPMAGGLANGNEIKVPRTHPSHGWPWLSIERSGTFAQKAIQGTDRDMEKTPRPVDWVDDLDSEDPVIHWITIESQPWK